MKKTLVYQLILVLTISQCNIVYYLYKNVFSFNINDVGKDYVTLYGKKFSEIKKYIPDHSILSYSTVLPGGQAILTDEIIGKYFYAQYWLCPNIVADVPGEKQYVILDLPSNQSPDFSDSDYRLIWNFNNGLFLLYRKK